MRNYSLSNKTFRDTISSNFDMFSVCNNLVKIVTLMLAVRLFIFPVPSRAISPKQQPIKVYSYKRVILMVDKIIFLEFQK